MLFGSEGGTQAAECDDEYEFAEEDEADKVGNAMELSTCCAVET
jgi:hypothetical protein